MHENIDSTQEPGTVSPRSEHGPPRKPYEAPRLTEWGSLRELTGSGLSGFDDVNNDQGSEGV